MNIIEKYQQFLSELEANPNIEFNLDLCKEFKFLYNATMDLLLEEFEEENIQIDEANQVYLHLSSLSIDWDSKLKNVDMVLHGGFKINGMLEAMTNHSSFWKGAFSLPPGKEVPEGLKHFTQLGWFEHQAWEDGRYGCFIKQAGIFPPPLAFYNCGWYVKLDMNLEEYFTKMFEMYAVRGWQFFYVDVTSDIPYLDDVLRDMRIAAEQLPLLFPEKDWSFQIEKYQEDLNRLKK